MLSITGRLFHIAKKLIENLKQYHSDNMLRCAVIAYLVHHNTNTEQCTEASKLFNKIDINGDGKIEQYEHAWRDDEVLEAS